MKSSVRTRPISVDTQALVCPKCGAVWYPVPMVCSCGFSPLLHDLDWERRALSDHGRLVTWTRLKAVPEGIEKESLTLGMVELSDGVHLVGQLDLDQPASGMHVDIETEECSDGPYRRGVRFVCRERHHA